MTDREMLELAAKAAGWTGFQSKHGYWRLKASDGTIYNVCQGRGGYSPNTGVALEPPTMSEALLEAGWDPLNDDGDALRLAVKLGISDLSLVVGRLMLEEWCELTGVDLVRRAIVRAAAEIGKARP